MRLLYVDDGQLLTLDDDLMSSRSADVPVKMLNDRKAEQEGHNIDVVADTLFRLEICARFNQRDESTVQKVSMLLAALKEGRGEMQCRTTVFTVDRGCGRQNIIDTVSAVGFSSFFIMPDHLLKSHTYHDRSYLGVVRNAIDEKCKDQHYNEDIGYGIHG